MVAGDFNDDGNCSCFPPNSCRVKDNACIFTDVVEVGVAILDDDIFNSLSLAWIGQVTATILQFTDNGIGDRFNDKEGFFADTEQVIVKAVSEDDIPSPLLSDLRFHR